MDMPTVNLVLLAIVVIISHFWPRVVGGLMGGLMTILGWFCISISLVIGHNPSHLLIGLTLGLTLVATGVFVLYLSIKSSSNHKEEQK